MARILVFASLAGLSAVASVADAAHRHATHFVAHEVATGLANGYQIVVADFNRDRKPDLLPVASGLTELAWFENPTWARHVIASGLDTPENADAFDVDGDGIPEVGFVYGFDQTPATSTGVVAILRHRGDPTAPWLLQEIDRIPTSHRVVWADVDGGGRKVLVNAPLVGARAEPPDFRDQTPLVFYRPGAWRREPIAAAEGLVHGLRVHDWNGTGRDAVITAGFAGVQVDELVDGSWRRSRLVAGDPAPWPKSGASDFAVVRLGNERLFATIEPWHGNQLVVYRMADGSWRRSVIDAQVSLGHTVLGADLDADGREVIIVSDRGRNEHGVYLYSAREEQWDKEVLDDTIQASGCVAADLNGDTRLDLVCIGRATANLKWYENTGP